MYVSNTNFREFALVSYDAIKHSERTLLVSMSPCTQVSLSCECRCREVPWSWSCSMSLVSLVSLLSPVPLVPLPCPVLVAGSWGLAAVGNARGAAGPVPTAATSPVCSHLCQMGWGQSAGGWGSIAGVVGAPFVLFFSP